MSEIKISEFFNLPVSDDFIGRMDHSQCVKFVSDGVFEFEAVVHAINNHDRLTEENQKLREALQGMVDQFGEPDGSDFINEADYAVVSNAKKVLFMIEHGLGDEDVQGGNREDVA
jgi:hypothetical protein